MKLSETINNSDVGLIAELSKQTRQPLHVVVQNNDADEVFRGDLNYFRKFVQGLTYILSSAETMDKLEIPNL